MRVSNKCLNFVKEAEGCYLTAYQDIAGVWTIGYGITSADKGITGKTIKKGMKITQKQADEWLEESLNEKYLPLVLKYQKKYNFNTSQIDALVSFAYNIGSIDQLTAKGTRSIPIIERKMLEYCRIDGKFIRGLYIRRLKETQMFNAGPKAYDGGFPKLPSRGYFQEGDKGKEVEKLQKLLDWLDLYDGKIDGIYGEKTEEAVRKLQGRVRTTKNGKFGNKCLPWCKKFRK